MPTTTLLVLEYPRTITSTVLVVVLNYWFALVRLLGDLRKVDQGFLLSVLYHREVPMSQSIEYPDIPFIEPKSWTSGRIAGCPKVIVVHYTAGTEGPNSAENGAAYDQVRTDGTSTHYFVDSDSIIQCVYTWDEAHTARRYGNDIGIQYELCGTKQTREQWLDAVSNATMIGAARQAAQDAKKYGLEIRRLTVSEVRACHPYFGNKPIRGFCGHIDITLAFPEDNGTHTDPGTEFPWDVFLSYVQNFYEGVTVVDTNDLYAWQRIEAISYLQDKFSGNGGFAALDTKNSDVPLTKLLKEVRNNVAAIKASVETPPSLAITDEQIQAWADLIAEKVVVAPDNPLGDADKPAIKAAVKEALAEGVIS